MVARDVQDEMEKRLNHLVTRISSLRAESEESWKTIETAEKTLLECLNKRDYDVAHYFSEEAKHGMKEGGEKGGRKVRRRKG